MNLTEAIICFGNISRINHLVCCQCSTFTISKLIFKLTISALSQVGFILNWPYLKIIHRGRLQSTSSLIGRRTTNLLILTTHELFLCQLEWYIFKPIDRTKKRQRELMNEPKKRNPFWRGLNYIRYLYTNPIRYMRPSQPQGGFSSTFIEVTRSPVTSIL